MKTDRIIRIIATSTLLLSSAAFIGCDRPAPVEQTDVERRVDDKLAGQVKAALGRSTSFKFPDVQITAFKGNVQLSGFVLTADQKTSAETVAKGVPGVVSVENKISLKE